MKTLTDLLFIEFLAADSRSIQLAQYFLRIVLRVLLSLGCINLKNLCAHLQEEILTIPKHPRLAQFDESEAKL